MVSGVKLQDSGSSGSEKGFTLFELLVVIVIISISLAICTVALAPGLRGAVSRASAKRVATTLARARNLAVSEARPYYVHLSEDGLRIVASDGTLKERVSLPRGTSIGPAGGSTVSFYPRGGSSGGSFEVLDTETGKRRHSITVDPATGRIRVL